MNELTLLRDELREFAGERDWEQFHTPKNLAMALIVEAGELAEHFQWLTGEQSQSLTDKQYWDVTEEIADVFIYLVRLADVTGVDLIRSAHAKIKHNIEKYPADEVRGSAEKR